MLGAGALIVAGFGFGVFWGSGLLAFDAPWSAGLALHGLWMGALGLGLIRLVQPLRGTARTTGWAGAATTVIGMLTAFPIFAVGLILIATTEWLQGTRRPAAGALAAGAILLLASLPLEGRFDGSGTPEPGQGMPKSESTIPSSCTSKKTNKSVGSGPLMSDSFAKEGNPAIVGSPLTDRLML